MYQALDQKVLSDNERTDAWKADHNELFFNFNKPVSSNQNNILRLQ